MPQKEFFRVLSRLTNPLCDCLLSQCSLFHCSCLCVCFFFLTLFISGMKASSVKQPFWKPEENEQAAVRGRLCWKQEVGTILHCCSLTSAQPSIPCLWGGGRGGGPSLLSGLTTSHCHVMSSLIFQILSQLKKLPPVSFSISFFIGV